MSCDNSHEKALKKIEDAKKCMSKYIYCIGATGPRGPQGPSGDSNSTCCDCIRQMRNIIEQIIELYPNSNLFITLDSGDAVLGTPGSIVLGPAGDSGVFEVINQSGTLRQLISICGIDSIRINNVTFNNSITFLQAPDPLPTGCCSDCDSAFRELLPIGTNTSIISNTQVPAQGTVIRNEYGMIVLQNTADNYITFVSSCRADLAYISNE